MTSVAHTPIELAMPARSLDFNQRLGQLDQAINDVRDGLKPFRILGLGDAVHLTIVGDAVTVTRSYHTLSPQAGTSDDLSTINGAVNGQRLTLRLQNSGDTITLKHNVGNIVFSAGADFVLNDVSQVVELFYNVTTSKWVDDGANQMAFQVIDTQTFSGGLATFSNINPNFRDLYYQLNFTAGGIVSVTMRFNGDTGGNYHLHLRTISGGSITFSLLANTVSADIGPSASARNHTWIRIYNYRSGNPKNYIFRNDTSISTTRLGSGMWLGTDPITSISLSALHFPNGYTVNLIGIL